MSAEGYQQAIDNLAYEFDRITTDLEAIEGDPFAAAAILMSGSNPEMVERTRKLDHIVTVIASTYHRTEEQIDRDIEAAIKQRVQAYS